MKQKVLIIFLIICMLISGCSKDTKSTTKTGITPAAQATIPATEAVVATQAPEADSPYNYSSHTDPDESRFKTQLADPSKLKEGKPVFALMEQPSYWSITFQGFSVKNDVFGYDVRGCNISGEDLSVVENFNDLTFSNDTIWPEKLPKGFDPEQILEYNKNPGLGIRALHDQGITGDGVGIAIIDQALLLDHEQYKDNLMYYEKIHCIDDSASMHGPAVASIAVGKDIGVAPGAKLYFIAITSGHSSNNSYEFDASITADAINRVLEINQNLSEKDKIRVISISKGYSSSDLGYKELHDAIKKADELGVFVLTTSTSDYYKGFSLFGMDRDYQDDPDNVASYQPVSWAASDFYASPNYYQNFILFPIGSRTFAGSRGTDDYSISRNGGLSWAVPWCAGLYALCCQVKPDITPQEFIDLAKSTAVTTEIEHDGKTYQLGKIINPAAVIDALQK